MNGWAQLQRLQRAIRAGDDVPPDLRYWLDDAINRHESGQRPEQALQLYSSHELRRARNQHIARAGRLMNGPATTRAVEIQRCGRKIAEYLDSPELIEPELNQWERHILRALQCASMPAINSIRQLLD